MDETPAMFVTAGLTSASVPSDGVRIPLGEVLRAVRLTGGKRGTITDNMTYGGQFMLDTGLDVGFPIVYG